MFLREAKDSNGPIKACLRRSPTGLALGLCKIQKNQSLILPYALRQEPNVPQLGLLHRDVTLLPLHELSRLL